MEQADQLVALAPAMLDVHFLRSDARPFEHEGCCVAAAVHDDVGRADVAKFAGTVLAVEGDVEDLLQGHLDGVLGHIEPAIFEEVYYVAGSDSLGTLRFSDLGNFFN